jgi:hypothetical protein
LVDTGTSILGQLVTTWQDDFYNLWNMNSSVRSGVCG